MCVVAIAHLASDRYPLIVAANRDERHARSSAPAGWWDDSSGILGGRDLVAGGTWLGIGANGRFAAVTNIFEGSARPAERSRGALVGEFLGTDVSAWRYARDVSDDGVRYGPFNLLLLAGGRLSFASNRKPACELEEGVHVFGNNRPGTDWPKLRMLSTRLEQALAETDPSDGLLDCLSGTDARGTLETAPESLFIVGPDFGTRCSTVLTVDTQGNAEFVERSFLPDGTVSGTVRFAFELPAPAVLQSKRD